MNAADSWRLPTARVTNATDSRLENTAQGTRVRNFPKLQLQVDGRRRRRRAPGEWRDNRRAIQPRGDSIKHARVAGRERSLRLRELRGEEPTKMWA